jgi:Pyruvate/2-oxoacid:ferredoxin oxidoreductase gamma subunit
MANMAMLGALVRLTDLVSLAAVDEAMRKTFSAKLQKLIGKSREVLQLGFDKVEQGP